MDSYILLVYRIFVNKKMVWCTCINLLETHPARYYIKKIYKSINRPIKWNDNKPDRKYQTDRVNPYLQWPHQRPMYYAFHLLEIRYNVGLPSKRPYIIKIKWNYSDSLKICEKEGTICTNKNYMARHIIESTTKMSSFFFHSHWD